MTENLVVDPASLTTAGTVFRQSGAELAALGADAPLTGAASAVPQLQTGAACHAAGTAIAADTATLAESAQSYGDNLAAAATRYTDQDAAAAQALTP
ncbi:type VII secretion target [Mycolicibacterium neoaurum]|uniref:type VII secretion target n=1 Tax=Mycolicibacterium neoaurum TaxID=1795 RepID=UPI002673840E|nr:type VII secretion target [Mycolicibacterium neoaurum]MDO3401259.1 type VII secretion target [Mycolicibacterium neoaurum]